MESHGVAAVTQAASCPTSWQEIIGLGPSELRRPFPSTGQLHDLLVTGPQLASGADSRGVCASRSGSGMLLPSRNNTPPASTAASAPPHQTASGAVCRRRPPIAGPRAKEMEKVRPEIDR